MYKLDLTRDALAFWEKLDAKQYRQIGRKILSLLNQPQPADACKSTDRLFRLFSSGRRRVSHYLYP